MENLERLYPGLARMCRRRMHLLAEIYQGPSRLSRELLEKMRLAGARIKAIEGIWDWRIGILIPEMRSLRVGAEAFIEGLGRDLAAQITLRTSPNFRKTDEDELVVLGDGVSDLIDVGADHDVVIHLARYDLLKGFFPRAANEVLTMRTDYDDAAMVGQGLLFDYRASGDAFAKRI